MFGHARLDEGLLQLLSASPESGLHLLGHLSRERGGSTSPVVVDSERGIWFMPQEPSIEVGRVELVDVERGLESRRIGVGGNLAESRVLLVGAGSLGSMVGLLLAQAGVGHFVVLDNDRLDAANLSRHACGLDDLGRSKAQAVAQLLTRRAVWAAARDLDLLALSEDELDRLVGSVDLVVATTDSPAAQFTANESCVRAGRLGLFAGAYERAAGGEIIAYRPGAGPCLFCAVGFRVEVAPEVAPRERRQAYQDAQQHRMVAEPGLGVDVSFLASATAAIALSLLDPAGSRADLIPEGCFLLLHGGSVPRESLADIFHHPFEALVARVARNEACPVCGWLPSAGI